MQKEVGKIYWCPEQEFIVRLIEIDNSSYWPYRYDTPDGKGGFYDGDSTRDLWDKEECLEEITRLEAEIQRLRDYIDIVES